MNNIGFSVIFNEEKSIIYYDLGEQSNKQPLIQYFYDSESKIAVIIYGRIYYLSEGIWLKIDNNKHNNLKNIIPIYQKFGKEGLKQLEGEFSLVIIDAKQNNLIAMRDILGSFPLYFTQHHSTIIISTSIRYLVTNFIKKAKVNLDYIAQYLMRNQEEELQIYETPFHSINRVLRGHFLAVNKEGIQHQLFFH